MFSAKAMRRKVVAPLAAAAAVALVLTGCSGGLAGEGSTDDGEGPIKIGMLAPFSGAEAAFGDYMKYGAQLAVDEINEAGGVNGRDLELVTEDDACDATTAASAANKLVTAGIAASVGGYCSGATQPTLPIFADANIPMVIPAANSNALVDKGAFMINGTGTQQAESAVKFAEQEGATTIGVLNDQTDYSKDLSDTFVEKSADAGMEVVHNGAVNPGDKDFSANVKSLIDDNPEFVYWTGYYQAGGLLTRQLREAGFTGNILVGDGSVDSQFAEIAGDGFTDNVFGTFTKTPDMLDDDSWISAYEELAGDKPGPYSMQAYDAVRVVAEGIEQAGSTDGADIHEAITKIDGLDLLSSGPLKFTDEGTLASGGFVIVTIGDEGSFVLHDDLQG